MLAKFFVKHVTPQERAQRVKRLAERKWKYYYATDYSSFEKHFTAEVMRNIEFVVYEHLLKGSVSREDRKFLYSILSGVNKLRTRQGHKATVQARRMSGEMCTSLGNTLTNFLICAYVMHSKGYGLDGFDGLFEGDDGLIASNVELNSDDFKRCGFDIKLERITNPCSASFCGLIFAESGQTIRDPMRFFQGFGWTSSFIHAGDAIMLELLKAKSLSALYETPACPLVSAAAQRCLITTKDSKARFTPDGYHVIPSPDWRPEDVVIKNDTRVLFEQQFGIPVPEQVRVEREIMAGKWDSLSGLMDMSSRVSRARRTGYLAVRKYSDIFIYAG